MTIEQFSKRGATAIGGLLAAVLVFVCFSVNYVRYGGALSEQDQLLNNFEQSTQPPALYLVEAFALAMRMVFTDLTRFITSGIARSSLGGHLTSHKHHRGMLLMNSSAPKNRLIHFAACGSIANYVAGNDVLFCRITA